MRFGKALELCKQGERIRRTGWNGKKQFVYYQKGSVIPLECMKIQSVREYVESYGGATVSIMGHFDIFTEQKVVQCGWLASQGDMQAEDWEVV